MEERGGLENTKIQEYLDALGDENAHARRKARQELVSMGTAAVGDLTQALTSLNWHRRWEAAKALGEIGSPEAAPALVLMLSDEDTGVRWAAMGSLVRLGRSSLHPLFELLLHNFHSGRVREGAHHVLHELKKRGKLTPEEEQVLSVLEGAKPSIEVPWVVSAALKKETLE